MDYRIGRQAVREVREEYKQINYDLNQIIFPTTNSTLGMLILGDVAMSKKEYDRSYQCYYDIFRRLKNDWKAGSENVYEVPFNEYKRLTIRRLERLVDKIENDHDFSRNKYFYRRGDPVIDFARQYIVDLKNYERK